MKVLLISMMMLGVIACNEKSDSSDSKSKKSQTAKEERQEATTEAFERQNLAGEIDGQAWTFISGRVTAPDAEGKSYLTLWDADMVNPCAPAQVGERTVVAKIELKEGRIELSEENKITLTTYDGEVARSKEMKVGVLKISRIEGGMVHGAMMGKYDDTNHLTGAFEATVCAE